MNKVSGNKAMKTALIKILTVCINLALFSCGYGTTTFLRQSGALLIFLILTVGLPVVADNTFTTSSGHIVEFKKFDKNYFATLQYLRHIDSTIGRLVKDSSLHDKTQKCKFFISPDNKDGIRISRLDGQLTIALHSDSELWKNDYKTNRKIIGLLILARIGIAPERYNEVIPAWVLSGFIGLCRQKEFAAKIVDLNYLPGLRACAVAGQYPKLKTVLRYPMNPEEHGAAYEFYEETCRFMLREANDFSTGSENLLRDIIVLTAKNKYTRDEIFNTTLGRVIVEKYSRNFPSKLDDEAKIQAWFEYTVKSRVISPYNPLTAVEFRRKLQELKQVSCIIKKGNQQNHENFTIDQLPLKFDELEDKNAVVLGKQREIEQMAIACPPLLFEATANLHRAIAAIGSVKKDKASRQIAESVDIIEKQLEKQMAIERFLNETAFSDISASLLYSREINEVSRPIYEPWPNLYKYLANEQRKFLE
jgi:hypothetical protein